MHKNAMIRAAASPRTRLGGAASRQALSSWRLGVLAILWVSLLAAPACNEKTASADGATCGKPGLKDCPLQAWMKSNLVKPKGDGDFDTLAKNVTKLPSFAPDPAWKSDWTSMAKTAADAASRADRDELSNACNACHVKYRKIYREKYRENPIPF